MLARLGAGFHNVHRSLDGGLDNIHRRLGAASADHKHFLLQTGHELRQPGGPWRQPINHTWTQQWQPQAQNVPQQIQWQSQIQQMQMQTQHALQQADHWKQEADYWKQEAQVERERTDDLERQRQQLQEQIYSQTQYAQPWCTDPACTADRTPHKGKDKGRAKRTTSQNNRINATSSNTQPSTRPQQTRDNEGPEKISSTIEF